MHIREMQSSLSVNPPWPGRVSAKSLISYALLKPEAKNPAKGATSEANTVTMIE